MSKLRIAVIGANGQLGTDLIKVFSKDSDLQLFPLTHKDIDIVDKNTTNQVINRIKPDIVINTAAYHRVNDCETNLEKAFLINAFAQKNLAEYCSQQNSVLVYISTDYVFGLDRKKTTPYKETDSPGPLNVYGLSKLTGEYFTRYICKKYFILRSSGLFGLKGSSLKGGNFVETMLKFAHEKMNVRVVNDQFLAPTYTVDLAKQIHKLIKTDSYGIYHASALGECSWYTFAKEIFKITNTKVHLIPITSKEYYTPAKRPLYSVLGNENLKNLNLNIMPDWHIGLKNYLIEKDYI